MNVHPTRAVETFNNQVALLKKQIYVKSVQAIACNSLKDELKPNELMIHVDYKENFDKPNRKCLLHYHPSFIIFTAVAIKSEASDCSRIAFITYFTKVVNFMREQHHTIPLKLTMHFILARNGFLINLA